MIQLRDLVRSAVPVWLSDRKGFNVGFRVVYAIATILDAAIDVLTEGMQARMPGLGTPTALPRIGSDRLIVRGPGDTDAEYAAKLRDWRKKHARRGSEEAIARQIHEYLPNHPKVRIVNRLGVWTTVEADGTLTREVHEGVWDWDSISNPERATDHHAEMWAIIYPTHYGTAGNWGDADGDTFGDNGLAFGMDAPLEQVRTIRTLIEEWQSAGSRMRCVIFTFDPTDFDPVAPGSLLPDGHWGRYSKIVAGDSVPSRPLDLRFLDHESAP